MPKKGQIFTIQGISGTALELHHMVTKDMTNAPSVEAVRRRLQRGETLIKELRRPAGVVSSASAERKRIRAQETKRGAGKDEKMKNILRRERESINKKYAQKAEGTKETKVEVRLVYGKRYFRANSLYPWPELDEAEKRGELR